MAKKQEQPDALQTLKQAIRSKNPGRLYFFLLCKGFMMFSLTVLSGG